uniref:Uncharacterized protein n=1 Tax=Oryza glumipatula TaxID=40148 RepID=A0A0E0AJF3_9ORYZ
MREKEVGLHEHQAHKRQRLAHVPIYGKMKGSIVVTGLGINYPTIWILSDDSFKKWRKIILTI